MTLGRPGTVGTGTGSVGSGTGNVGPDPFVVGLFGRAKVLPEHDSGSCGIRTQNRGSALNVPFKPL
jgi:hypothetical protein